jgi:hypothetical protein
MIERTAIMLHESSSDTLNWLVIRHICVVARLPRAEKCGGRRRKTGSSLGKRKRICNLNTNSPFFLYIVLLSPACTVTY